MRLNSGFLWLSWCLFNSKDKFVCCQEHPENSGCIFVSNTKIFASFHCKYERTEELEHQVKTPKREQTYVEKVNEKLNNQILQELLEENRRLKEIMDEYEKLVEMGILKIPEDMKL